MTDFMPPVQTLLGFLSQDPVKPDVYELQRQALQTLCTITPVGWCEVAEDLGKIEEYHDKCEGSEECRGLSALLLSQTYFHLEMYTNALQYALLAGPHFLKLLKSFYPFEASVPTPCDGKAASKSLQLYVDRIVALAIDEYIRYRAAPAVRELSSAVLQLPVEPAADQAMIDHEKVDALVEALLTLESRQVGVLSDDVLKLLLGIALEACNIQKTEQVLRVRLGQSSFSLMRHVIHNHELLMATKSQKMDVFRLIASLYAEQLKPLLDLAEEEQATLAQVSPNALEDLPWYSEVLYHLSDVDGMAALLRGLLNASLLDSDGPRRAEMELHWLRALQLAFDLLTYSSQIFLSSLRQHQLLTVPPAELPEEPSEGQVKVAKEDADAPVAKEDTETSESKHTDTQVSRLTKKLSNLQKVLIGDYQTALFLKFANQMNNTDLAILDAVKSGLDSRHAILHTTLICAHGLLQRGTTCDIFLRRNLDWFGKTLCWGKFTATASLGVVHQTHAEKSFRVLSTYLPGLASTGNGNSSNTSGSSFSDGGSLYALGLIHANRSDKPVVDYLLEQLFSGSGAAGRANASDNDAAARNTVNEVTQYGACLGLGFAAMGCATPNLCNALRSVLLMDSAVSGEAAALGLGLVMIGTGNKDGVEDLLQYSKDTRHEKIIRACALAVGLICFKCEEGAAPVLQRMINDPDPLVRYGGCFALGLAYCGTANETSLRSLLHLAVSDSSDDVRRAAVLSIPYLLCNVPEQTPKVLRLLTDSFNFHVRFAAILAVGISCAGTASPESLAVIVPATRDAVDLVRQAAFIALGFVMMQCPEKYAMDLKKASQEHAPETERKINAQPKTTRGSLKAAQMQILSGIPTPSEVRQHLLTVSTDPKEDQMARVGAIMGLGLIDAGGRNVCCSFFSNRGLLRRESIVGFVLFSQYWYWYPLMLTISLSMFPTALIGVNGNLEVPESYCVESQAAPSEFAYPDRYQPKKKEPAAQTVTSLLAAATRRGVAPKKVEPQKEAEPKAPEVAPEPEPQTQVIPNMSRILAIQAPLIRAIPKSRYTPIFNRRRLKMGIVVLADNTPDEPENSLS